MAEIKAEASKSLTSIKDVNDLASAAAAQAEATNQYFWFAESDTGAGAGAHVTETPQEDFLDDPTNGGGNVHITSNGISVRNGIETLASFSANGVQVGADSTQNFRITSDAIRAQNADGSNFFAITSSVGTIVSDVQVYGEVESSIIAKSITLDAGGIEQGAEIYCLGLTMDVKLYNLYNNDFSSYTIDGGGTLVITGKRPAVPGFASNTSFLVDFENPPRFEEGTASSVTSEFTGAFIDDDGAGYTLTLTATVSYDGASTVTVQPIAKTLTNTSGTPSGKTKLNTTESGYSVPQIRATSAVTYAPAFTLGVRDGDEGAMSTVVGRFLYAEDDDQFAIGHYNVRDVGSHAFMIGNGTELNRSNAFAVAWDGDFEFGLDETAGAGTADGDLYAAITALGWENEVIV